MRGIRQKPNGFAKSLFLIAIALVTFVLALSAPAALASPRPIAAYSFDEGSGTTLTDSAGDHDGTITGAAWTAGRYGSALDFDGTDDLVSIADHADLDLTDSFTIEAWVRPDALGNWSSPISKASWTGGLSGYSLAADYRGFPTGIVLNAGASAGAADTSALPTDGTWKHLAFTSDGTTLKLYIDGQLAGSQTAIAAAPTAADLQIGHSQVSTGKYFDGAIDEVRLYDQALDQSQVQSDRDSAVGLDRYPIAAYSFDEGSGTTLTDSAGDHDGTITGAAWTAGRYGSALDFDGTDDLVSIADHADLDLTDSFTIEAWVRPDALGNWSSPISKASWTGGLSGYSLAADYRGFPTGIVLNAGASAGAADTSALPTDGTWKHLAFTSDGTTLKLYIDGQLAGSQTAIAAAPTAADLQIGHSQVSTGKYFDGAIDEVRLYDQALDQSQVQSDRDTGVSDLGGAFSSTPALFPAFDPAVTDYVVRCDGVNPVAVSATADSGTTISVDGQAPSSGTFAANVALGFGQEFEVSMRRGMAERTYYVRCVPTSFPTWDYQRYGQPRHGLYVVAPHAVKNHYIVIFDSNGTPLWWRRDVRAPLDVKALSDGTLAWTLLNGAPDEIRNLDGTLVKTVSTVGVPVNAHDIQELPNGHFLLVSYPVREHVDMTSVGLGNDETVLDGEIQEVDAQGNLVWSWNSKDHISLAETGRWYGLPGGQNTDPGANNPGGWDLVHINSVEPVLDENGGLESVIASMRHVDAVYKIDEASRDIVWKLGGTTTPQSLSVLNDPQSFPIAGQHDARLQPDGTLTLHDNNTELYDESRVPVPPRAVRYAIDENAQTATLVEQVTDDEVPTDECCGSARRSADGSWLMSWGGIPFVTEFDASGNRTFKVTFGGVAFSYRAVSVDDGVLSKEQLRAGMDAQYPR